MCLKSRKFGKCSENIIIENTFRADRLLRNRRCRESSHTLRAIWTQRCLPRVLCCHSKPASYGRRGRVLLNVEGLQVAPRIRHRESERGLFGLSVFYYGRWRPKLHNKAPRQGPTFPSHSKQARIKTPAPHRHAPQIWHVLFFHVAQLSPCQNTNGLWWNSAISFIICNKPISW